MTNVAFIGEPTNAQPILVKKSDGKRSLWRPRCRLEDVDRSHLAQDMERGGFLGT
jgi:hypothetical protein